MTSSTPDDVMTFKETHRDAWEAAEKYCDEQRAVWEAVFDTLGVNAATAEAVVFPELVRYNSCQDYIESALVYGSYLTQGSKGFNYSIGKFQMKPSFVEAIEARWMRSDYASRYNIYFDTQNNIFARKARMSRINDNFWQTVYLAIFLKLLNTDYDAIIHEEPSRQVEIAATAYNHGCQWCTPSKGDIETIVKNADKKHFHTDFMATSSTIYYNYAEIALQHWKETTKDKDDESNRKEGR